MIDGSGPNLNPDPYLRLMDPALEGQKNDGSYGSRILFSPTIPEDDLPRMAVPRR
jgi:hypothetical protein